jgi:hypothetical protein
MVTAAVASPPEARALLNSLSVGKIKSVAVGEKDADWPSGFDYYIKSFETPDACEGFELAEADVREFFKTARIVSNTERGKISYSGESRCVVDGALILENGEKVNWMIDRARNATVLFNSADSSGSYPLYFRCEKCKSGKFYKPKSPELAAFRPLVKSVIINQNGAFTGDISGNETPDTCSEFKLTEAEVKDFFSSARASSRRENLIDADMSNCFADGMLTLQDGNQAGWSIDQARRGEIRVTRPSGGAVLYYYCATCFSKKFYPACDSHPQ